MVWIDYDDGHAGGYPHECERCPTCERTREHPFNICSDAWHLADRPIIGTPAKGQEC
jgi:hypothetical protein